MARNGSSLHHSASMESVLRSILHSIDGCVESKIARTSHSTVYCVKSGLYKRLVAVKMIDVNSLPKSAIEKFLPRELLFTQIVRHPYIGRALSVRTSYPTKIAIISEYYSGGTLLNLILRQKRIREFPHACRLFRQLTEAIHYLHDRGVVHRDIKAENVLLDSNGNVKLIDFGFARYINQKERSTSFCGTKPYSAPEIVQHQPYDGYASDWYAMGVLLYTMLTGKWPYDAYEKNKNLSKCIFFSAGIPSDAARDLILRLMNEDYRFRGGYNTILNSEWMKNFHNEWLIIDQHFTYEVIRTS
ncbi:Testis-specific serine/threonine-protein kinase [Dirofilaria immitis]